MKNLLFPVLAVIVFCTSAQTKLALDPVISPALFQPSTEITVTYDVTGTSMAGLSRGWAWVWIPGKSINAKYNVNPAPTSGAPSPAEFTKVVEGGRTLFRLTFKPADFFNESIASETQFGILFKGSNWTGCGISVCQTTDYVAQFWDGSFQVLLTSPTTQPLFVINGQQIPITAEASVNVDYDLFINDVPIAQQTDTRSFSYTHTVTETSGYAEVKLVGASGSSSSEVRFLYLLASPSPVVMRPSGIIPGINYHSDPTKVTLCLWAPDKSSVYVRGDFSDWDVLPENLMNRDGEYFWIELSTLIAGQEYAFQYLVNESIWLADPYADKILDPDDQYIPSTSYPNLKPYPQKALLTDWYFNRLSVFQTDQQPYQWQATNYQRPPKEKLVVYELLIRDFFGVNDRTYQNLIDTLSYLKTLGVNAIELMPIMEFNGNDSWGYNPTFMFAVDKYYGTKNKFKEFIDICHQHDIAVILDIAMNHQDIPNSYVMMDFNFTSFTPTATNKWFNVTPRHPFNVFFDMNHESVYTKAYLDTVNYYWLNEFKVDGYRFDLSKGFTQVNTYPSNVSGWSAYDASRIVLLKRMADKIWTHFPDAYVILEHFAVNSEEKELAEYKAAEGKGMLFWGNMNHAYLQSAMGYSQDSDISWVYHGTRGWSVPHVIGYMESHDEERMMFKNLQFGNTNVNPPYSVKNLYTALDRVKAASTIFYTVPGPKMLWQFGELGYDISIDEGGRVSPKPVKWEYRDDYHRYRVYEHIADLIRLRKEYNVFNDGSATITGGNNLVKQLTLKNSPYVTTPVNTSQMNVQVAVNFDVKQNSVSVSFPHTGTWYDYYAYGNPIVVTSVPYTLTMLPGEYKLFTDVEITNPLITSTEERNSVNSTFVYPNPVDDLLLIRSDREVKYLKLVNTYGVVFTPMQVSENAWDMRSIPPGLYVATVVHSNGTNKTKVIKR
ncbi:MAG: T9SS type A sorting domain-containing protein [Cyclobacteriaceae bacterium]|nr:T9SS type A sorting domain-containing protein [Cyclobacteriaceae bacterium]